jgi:hypothetical protein
MKILEEEAAQVPEEERDPLKEVGLRRILTKLALFSMLETFIVLLKKLI